MTNVFKPFQQFKPFKPISEESGSDQLV